MPALTAEQQNFIMAEFALSKSGAQIVKSLKKEFGIDVDRQQVWHYNPDNPDLAQKWKKLYAELREKLIVDVHGCVGAHKGFRLRELVSLYWAAKEMGNSPHAQDLLKQMAQESNDFWAKDLSKGDPRKALAALLGISEADLPENAGK